jgi:hypothetical protein
LPWATGLVSYPSNCILFSGGRPLCDLPHFESYCASVLTVRPGRLPLGALNSRRRRSFFLYRLRHPYNPTALVLVHTVERSRSTLAHSSNCRSVTDCVRFIPSNRKSKASLGFAVGSCYNTAFVSLCHNYRSPPDSIFVYLRGGTTLPAGAGDICLLRLSARSRRMRPTARP